MDGIRGGRRGVEAAGDPDGLVDLREREEMHTNGFMHQCFYRFEGGKPLIRLSHGFHDISHG